MEGEIGRFRRRHLTPVPAAADLAELNERVAAADAADDGRQIAARTQTVGQAAAAELPLLRPLPADRFEVAVELSCRVDEKSRVCVRQSYYSVPVRLAGRRVAVRLGARQVQARDGARAVACHPRSLHKGSEDLVLDHYLEVLARKPGALPGATALAAARAAGAFTDTHQRYWDTARRRLGDPAGTRALIGVLLLHRGIPAAAVLAGVQAALGLDRIDTDLVAVEARRFLDTAGTTPAAAVVPIGAGPGLAGRPPPSLAGYDSLLTTRGVAR